MNKPTLSPEKPLEVERVPLDSLKPYGKNPRRGNVEAIRDSLEHNGQFRPLVVRRKTNEILAGNHTWQAAGELGWTAIDAVYLDVTAEQAKRIVLADNRTSDLGTYDEEALADLLRSLGDDDALTGTGYDGDDLDRLLADLEVPPSPAPDDIPEVPPEPTTQPGDTWKLGPHRLHCGDCTDPEQVAALMDGELAAMMWTDPPYGVDYVGKTSDALTIANDGAEGIAALLRDAFASVDNGLRPGAAIYIAHPAGPISVEFGAAVLAQGWRFHQGLVWVKDSIVLGHSDYHYRHEPLILAYKPGGSRRGRGGKGWYGDNAQDSIFEVPRPKASRDHPTSKPIALITEHLQNSCPPRGIVLDPFAGSGSTLIAAEGLGRTAYLMELDPRYCDVIVRRWEAQTGKQAERG